MFWVEDPRSWQGLGSFPARFRKGRAGRRVEQQWRSPIPELLRADRLPAGPVPAEAPSKRRAVSLPARLLIVFQSIFPPLPSSSPLGSNTFITTPTGVPNFEGCIVIVILSPAFSVVFFHPCFAQLVGLLPSAAQCTISPLSSLASNKMCAWGLAHTNSVTIPVTTIVLDGSYDALVPWWAKPALPIIRAAATRAKNITLLFMNTSLEIQRPLRINHDPDDIGLLRDFVAGQMGNIHRYDHDVACHVLLGRIAFDPVARAGATDRFHGLAVGIVLGRVLEFAPDQKRSCASNHIIQF